ncbi:transmembrane emp24 domain-containing protein p24delta9-like [Senna tora]|uniref:Transmembrane emp24 domain-containing protein p24delta9-like n=1 Tax=Senna tora TaxID=362788 RepID=A0A834W9M9_9FABA|nr:transmembrane emp24 domain-containing protein p24delta9-like [Senna tora]
MIRLNPQPLRLLLLLFPVLALFSSPIESLRFELQSGHTKCISEDIKSNSMTVGKYNIVNPHEDQPLPDSHKVTVRVTSSYGNNYHYSDQVPSGQFAFVAVEAGDYMACFWAPDHKPQITMTIDFDWKTGVAAKDWSNVAKKGHVDYSNGIRGSYEVMEMELKKLYETVNSIHEEMYYLRSREEEMQELNSTTNSRMFWMSLLSLVICLSVAGMQLWHLKSFFEKKKII